MENGYPEHLIEKQLSHINADSTIAAYDRAEYLEKRKAMMQQWTDYLDSLRVFHTSRKPPEDWLK